MKNERVKELYNNMLYYIKELVGENDFTSTLQAIGFTDKEILEEGLGDIDLSTFTCIGNNRLEAYGSHMNFEMSFKNPEIRIILTFEEFCKELDKGYGNSIYLQISRLYEDSEGQIWYDNEYVD